MPGSMPEGKEFIKRFLLDKNPKRILDVGPGSGNYVDLLTKTGEYADYAGDALLGIEWVAVEIWEPYIEHFNLKYKYHQIIVSDIFDVDWEELGNFDVIILGDVLEHMKEPRAVEVIRNCVAHAKWVIISLPIVYFPQDPSYNNIYEAHVEQYSPERIKSLIRRYKLVDYMDGNIIGTYIIKGKND